MNTKDLSYHEVVVQVNGVDYKISDNYAYHLSCCRVTGWKLWFIWPPEERAIGGEYSGDQFKITVAGMVIVDIDKKEIEE